MGFENKTSWNSECFSSWCGFAEGWPSPWDGGWVQSPGAFSGIEPVHVSLTCYGKHFPRSSGVFKSQCVLWDVGNWTEIEYSLFWARWSVLPSPMFAVKTRNGCARVLKAGTVQPLGLCGAVSRAAKCLFVGWLSWQAAAYCGCCVRVNLRG